MDLKMAIEDLDENEIDENNDKQEKKNTCLLVCVLILLLMMVPSFLSLFAIS